jgi:Flp pilus assembly protein CpaB
MKKIIIIALAITTTGLISSCTKDNSVKPAVKTQATTVADKTDVGQADYTGGAAQSGN